MKAQLYWAIRHMKCGMRDFRFAVTCWWLSQRVDFLKWRWRFGALMPRPQPIFVPVRAAQEIRRDLRVR